MDKKFELTEESIFCCGVTVYRIKALKNFGKVKVGDLGGFVEKESNLSQKGNCWIYDIAAVCDNAMVYDNAEIYGSAMVYDNAEVYGNARAYDNAQIYNNARIYGSAVVSDEAVIYGSAEVYDNAKVRGNAMIYNNATVCDNAMIFGNTKISDKARVCDNAKIYNSATVCGNAMVCDNTEVNKEMYISSGIFTTNTIEESIRCQTGLIPCNGEIIAYKQVNKDLTSFYDDNFKYVVGEWAEAENPDMSDKSCASGLHFSNATYWDYKVISCDTTFLIAKIRLEDIITVQQGKIRCKRAFIMGTYNIEEGIK